VLKQGLQQALQQTLETGAATGAATDDATFNLSNLTFNASDANFPHNRSRFFHCKGSAQISFSSMNFTPSLGANLKVNSLLGFAVAWLYLQPFSKVPYCSLQSHAYIY
jgi:hypothetical protein